MVGLRVTELEPGTEQEYELWGTCAWDLVPEPCSVQPAMLQRGLSGLDPKVSSQSRQRRYHSDSGDYLSNQVRVSSLRSVCTRWLHPCQSKLLCHPTGRMCCWQSGGSQTQHGCWGVRETGYPAWPAGPQSLSPSPVVPS